MLLRKDTHTHSTWMWCENFKIKASVCINCRLMLINSANGADLRKLIPGVDNQRFPNLLLFHMFADHSSEALRCVYLQTEL